MAIGRAPRWLLDIGKFHYVLSAESLKTLDLRNKQRQQQRQ
jgi:hypothetical protein